MSLGCRPWEKWSWPATAALRSHHVGFLGREAKKENAILKCVVKIVVNQSLDSHVMCRQRPSELLWTTQPDWRTITSHTKRLCISEVCAGWLSTQPCGKIWCVCLRVQQLPVEMCPRCSQPLHPEYKIEIMWKKPGINIQNPIRYDPPLFSKFAVKIIVIKFRKSTTFICNE